MFKGRNVRLPSTHDLAPDLLAAGRGPGPPHGSRAGRGRLPTDATGARPPRGGGASLHRPLTCRGRRRWGCGGGPAASARVHASHLRHQLPQRRLNGYWSQPPPPPPSLRCSRAAPARRPLAVGQDQLLAREGGQPSTRLRCVAPKRNVRRP